MTDLERQARRMDVAIEGRPVFARSITNADLERKDEMDDELAELRRRHAKLTGRDARADDGGVVHVPGDVDECEDDERRLDLRREARELMKEIRRRDTLLVSLYIEDENGEPFSENALLSTPFRVVSKLSQRATEWAFGIEDEERRPTVERSASG